MTRKIVDNTEIAGTFKATGAVDLDSTLNVDGAATLNSGVTVMQPTLGSVVQRLQSTATNDDTIEDRFHGRATTTDATATTVLTIPITASNTYHIDVDVLGRRTGGTAGVADDGLVGKLVTGYKTVGGVVTLIGNLESKFIAPLNWATALVISGTNVLVQVTGVVNNNISWHVFVTMKKVGT